MSKYEQIIKQLIDAAPSWEKDGGGVRGRTIAPILSGLSSNGGMAEFIPQQFNQSNNESAQKSAKDPIADLVLSGRSTGGSECIGLGLYTKTGGTPTNPTTQLWVGVGTVAGQLPLGFDAVDGKNIANSGFGDVWAEVNINQITGEIASVAVSGGGNTPASTDTTSYYTLGRYEYRGTQLVLQNYGCGSVDVSICRNWFALNPPFYGLTLTRN